MSDLATELWMFKDIIIFIVGLVGVYYRLEQRIKSIEQHCTEIYDPFFEELYRDVAKKVLSPHTPKLDELIKKGLNIGFENLDEKEVDEYKKELETQIEHSNGEEAFLYTFLKNGIDTIRKNKKK
jgi:hypothetical protein